MSLEQMDGGQFRFYRWTDPATGEVTDLLSVTSIRSLCGEPFNLVNWKMANMADAALGTMKRTVVGPRGGIKEVRQVWEYPCEFARMYDASAGDQSKVDDLRKWLREQAEEPRNVAAARGTMTHSAIERGVAWDRIERPWVEAEFGTLSARDRKRLKRAVSDEDVHFVRNSVRQYWAMRASLPMVLLAREVRVVNLEVGYAGTFDALAWLLGSIRPDGSFDPLPDDKMAEALRLDANTVTAEDIQRVGGTIVLLDWKTASGLHTDYVVQAHAYLAAEFACIDNERNERITGLLGAAMQGGLVHIRPDGWGLYLFPFAAEPIRAFLGSVAFARFLAKYPEPTPIWSATFKGESTEEEEDA